MDSKRSVLWDMDGVLVDSGELHYQSWKKTLDEYSIPFNREKFNQTFGMNNANILGILLGKAPEPDFLEKVSGLKENRFRELIHSRLQLLPGVKPCLSRLWENGILQAVASSAPYANIEAIVDELDIRRYFAALVSAYALPSKPDPAVFLEAARQLGVRPEQCTVVEDSVVGVTAAKSAGMKCIAVINTHPRSALAAADFIVDSLEELELDSFT